MIILYNVSRICVKTGVITPHQSITIKSGKIVRIGTTIKEKIPHNVRYIDGTGKYVIPGLADMHVHLMTKDDLLLYLAHGVTTVRNLSGTTPIFAWKEAINKGSLLGPTIYTSGAIVDGQPPIWYGAYGIGCNEDAQLVVEHQKQQGADCIKVYSALHRDVYKTILAMAAVYNIPVDGHIPILADITDAFKGGHRCIEHMTGYMEGAQKEGSPAWQSFENVARSRRADFIDEERLEELVQQTALLSIWNCPTLTVFAKIYETDQSLDSLLEAPHIKNVHPIIRASWDPRRDFRRQSLGDDGVARLQRIRVRYREIAGRIHAAGGLIVAGTDAGCIGVAPGSALFEELQHMVDIGLSPLEALRTATVNPAAMLGHEQKFGSLVQGERADFLVLDANPLENIQNIARQFGVMVRGKWFFTADLASMVATQTAGYDQSLASKMLTSPFAAAKNGDAVAQYSMRFNDTEIAYGELARHEAEGELLSLREHFIFPSYEQFDIQMRLTGDAEGRLCEASVDNAHSTKRLTVNLLDHSDVCLIRIVGDNMVSSIEITGQLVLLHAAGVPLVLDHLPCMGSMFFLYRQCKGLAIGEELVVQAIDVDVVMMLQFVIVLRVKREKDASYAGVACAVFTLDKECSGITYLFTLYVNPKTGMPVGLTRRELLGLLEVVKVEAA